MRCGHDTGGLVLARCSAPGRVCSIAGSGGVGGTHSTGCRERFSMFSGRAGGLRACSGCCARNNTSGMCPSFSWRALLGRSVHPASPDTSGRDGVPTPAGSR
jgi:hypothetical protein